MDSELERINWNVQLTNDKLDRVIYLLEILVNNSDTIISNSAENKIILPKEK
jgi:hypothetical protein